MKKAWFALAALAGIAVWSVAIEYSTMQRGGLTVEGCKSIRSVYLGRDTANGTFMIEALGLENGCIPPDRHVAREIVKRLGSFENHSLSIVHYTDRLMLTRGEEAAARWLATAVAVHFAWDRLTWTSGTAPAVQSPRLKTEIEKFYNAYKGDDAATIVASLEMYLSRRALSPEAELDTVRHLVDRLQFIAPREFLYWSARASEWRYLASKDGKVNAGSYVGAIFCDDDRAISRVAELYLDGLASDHVGEHVLRALLRRADEKTAFRTFVPRVAEKLGEKFAYILESQYQKHDRESFAPESCATILRMTAERAKERSSEAK